jgi:hypothetical protein
VALTTDEQAQLDALTEKANAPEDNGGGRMENVDVYIDLSDEAAVKRGLSLGFLKAGDLEGDEGEGDEGGEGGEGEGDSAPKRRSYFPK